MSKHTPAPWEFVNGIIQEVSQNSEIVQVKRTLASINTFGINPKESEANAKLIAAAPELLEALIMCYKSLCTYGDHPIIEMYVEKTIKKAIL